ncbi:hypothetical protein SAMN05518846_115120 [Brevibacillus centrosporus]|uniref:Uncharacterized protein n=1 Tax=Brevibacillus centrosporus TaxID=54910 RepID=A0A1I4AN51_9BACL|nr:hypothetical protein SAMN05518846_115120 [Brevibacillus centrosporus]
MKSLPLSMAWAFHEYLAAVGDPKKARIHHELAKMYNPKHPSVVYNEAYFTARAQAQ